MMKLDRCPHCGGSARMRETVTYGKEARYVRCDVCGVQTPLVLIDSPSIIGGVADESTRYSAEQAERVAADKWNARDERFVHDAVMRVLRDIFVAKERSGQI